MTSGLGPTPQPVENINYLPSWLRLRQRSEELVTVNKFWQKELSKAKLSGLNWALELLRAAAAAALKQVVRLMHNSSFCLGA